MGTREWSSCSGLPNYRHLENEEDRAEIAKFWNVDVEFFPKQRGMFQTDIYHAIESGQIKGLWLIATNPMTSLPNNSRVRKAMEKLEFCAVQDCYEDAESTQYAHVYLPAGTWAEKEGVMTNTERRINVVKPISPTPGEAKPDLWIFNRMAERFNRDGRVSFPEQVPDEKFPIWLNTGRLIEHWHGRTKTGKIGNNNKYSPIPFIEITPDLCAEMGIQRGEYVRLVSRRSDAVVMAQPTQRVPKNMVFLPFHFHDYVNRLTLGLLDTICSTSLKDKFSQTLRILTG